MREVSTRKVVETDNTASKGSAAVTRAVLQEEYRRMDSSCANVYVNELDNSNVRLPLFLNVSGTIRAVLQPANEQGGNTRMGSVRPDGADLRTKLERPDDAIENLYCHDYKMSRSKSGQVYLALVRVEEYILYLEKKIKTLEKKI
jgi:hypothetical protein